MDLTQSPHYHIRWSGNEELDWACFPTTAEALKSARRLAQPGERYTIEEENGACQRCQDTMNLKFVPRAFKGASA
jgi:hypothetical protein